MKGKVAVLGMHGRKPGKPWASGDKDDKGELERVVFEQGEKIDKIAAKFDSRVLSDSTIRDGIILKSPNGMTWRLTISNAGAVVVTAVT